MKKLLLTALTMLFVTLSAQAQINLSYNLSSGQEYSSNVVIEQSIAQTMMGQTQNVESGQGFGVVFEVQDKNEDSYNIELTYKSIIAKQPMMGLDYNSETATGEPTGPAKAISSIIGANINFELKENGTIDNLSGTDELLDKMAENMGFADASQAQSFKNQMAAQYNSETLKTQLKSTLINYPEKSLNKGDTWESDDSMKSPFSMSILTTYKLVDFDNSTVTLDVNSAIETIGDELSMNGATMKPEIKGSQTGTIIIDRKTGLILSSKTTQDLSGVLKMTAPQQIEIPMEIKVNSEVTGDIK